MLYGKYTFCSVFEDDALLPYYKGSTFRGVFGHALRRVVCALKRQDCKDCLLRQKCVYAFVFEGAGTPEESLPHNRIASPPHPYVIEPPESQQLHFKEGERFNVSLLLFGKANDYLPYFIYAFEQMGALGIGKRVNGKRARFLLESVRVGDDEIYLSKDNRIRRGNFTQQLYVEDLKMPGDASVHRLQLTLKTPLRLKFENSLEASLPFHVLTRGMLRRISSLENFYGNGEPPLDYRDLVERAKSVEIIESSLRWFDWKRYSTRQDQSMLMGGLLGEITYEGALGEFLPFIRVCEKLHIGKQTSFGLGKIELTSAMSFPFNG